MLSLNGMVKISRDKNEKKRTYKLYKIFNDIVDVVESKHLRLYFGYKGNLRLARILLKGNKVEEALEKLIKAKKMLDNKDKNKKDILDKLIQ